MRYLKSQQHRTQMPEINLVPMMDVIMTILTFFIIVAMTLTGMQTVDLSLPDVQDANTQELDKLPEPFVLELSRTQQMSLSGKPSSEEQIAVEIRQYLQANPKGVVLLKADQQLAYKNVIQVLTRLQQIGGDRVSLAIEPK